MTVRRARAGELGTIQQLAVEAGRRFAEVDDPVVAACADDPPPDADALETARRAGRLWVATAGAEVVGFALAEVVDGNGHLEEVAVHPAHGGRGVGSDLVGAVLAWAAVEGMPWLTLTTFAAVAWNRPWYERLGFEVLADGAVGPELRRRCDEEAARGLDPSRRVCMRARAGPS